MSRGFYSAATRLLQEIIRDNAGTQLAGEAKRTLASIQMDGFLNLDEALRINEEVASEFRDTPVGLWAESDAIDLTLEKDNDLSRYQERYDALIVKIGGVPLRAVMRAREESPSGSSGVSFRSVPFLSAQEQDEMLFSFYTAVAFNTEGTGRTLATVDHLAVNDGLKLLMFLRERFPRTGGSRANWRNIFEIQDIFLLEKGITKRDNFPLKEPPPRIQPIAPRDGLTIGDRQPKIEVLLHDGDIREMQIDTASIVFKLVPCPISSSPPVSRGDRALAPPSSEPMVPPSGTARLGPPPRAASLHFRRLR